MKIENYDNRRPEFSKLYEEGRSELFLQGVADGYSGEQTHRPKRPQPPVLQVHTLPGDQILISGNTFPFKDDLKRLGGRWQPETKGWAFRQDRLEAIKSDTELNSFEDLWSGVPTSPPELMEVALRKWNAAIEEYGRGYVYGQERLGRSQIGRLSR